MGFVIVSATIDQFFCFVSDYSPLILAGMAARRSPSMRATTTVQR